MILVLEGESGSGKTTLATILSGRLHMRWLLTVPKKRPLGNVVIDGTTINIGHKPMTKGQRAKLAYMGAFFVTIDPLWEFRKSSARLKCVTDDLKGS